MLTDGLAQHGAALALRAANTLAGRVDLRNLAASVAVDRTAAHSDGVSELGGAGFRLAVAGRLASLCHAGALVCAAVGVPRFDSRAASDAASRHGAAAGWVELYREAGRAMFADVHGNWSVVIVDLANRRLSAGVDRFSIRPLCFGTGDGVLRFASRADEVPDRGGETDVQAIYDYVYHHFIPAPRTIFNGVSRLDAAHCLIAGAQALEIERYWQPRFASAAMSFPERKEAFLSALTHAIADQLPGESVGCYLSGGTDSSTVAGMVSRVTGRRVMTFSMSRCRR